MTGGAFLSTVQIFKRLTPSDRQRLAAVSRERRYAKGETLFRAGDPSDAVYVVKSGRVHLIKFLESGKASTTCVMASGDPFCCLPALDRKPYPADAVAAVESTVVQIPASAFQEMLQRNPAFLQDSLCLFCDRLRQMEHQSCMSYGSVEQRLAQVLLTLSKKFGPTIPLTKQEIADMAHTTVESAIRTLTQLKKRGLLTSARGSTTIVKLDPLQHIASS